MAKKNTVEEFKLVDENDFHTVEAYKALRTNIEFSIVGDHGKVILITSSLPREGKTNVVANLGLFLTYTGNKVLLIDCDLRKPKLHRFFNVTNYVGLSNVIMKKYTLDATIKNIGENLDILCSGPVPPNSVELLNSDEMKALVANVAQKYDYILIDTPPALQLVDAVVLSPVVNGIVLVIKYASTPVDIIKKTLQNFTKINAKVIGTVISQIATKQLSEYHRYAYYQYSYYYDNDPRTDIKHKQKNQRHK